MNQDKQSEGNSKIMSLTKECHAITSKNRKGRTRYRQQKLFSIIQSHYVKTPFK